MVLVVVAWNRLGMKRKLSISKTARNQSTSCRRFKEESTGNFSGSLFLSVVLKGSLYGFFSFSQFFPVSLDFLFLKVNWEHNVLACCSSCFLTLKILPLKSASGFLEGWDRDTNIVILLFWPSWCWSTENCLCSNFGAFPVAMCDYTRNRRKKQV